MKYLEFFTFVTFLSTVSSAKVCDGSYHIAPSSSRKEAIKYCDAHGWKLADITSSNMQCLSKWVYSRNVHDFTYVNSWNTDSYNGAAIALYPSADGLHSTINVPQKGENGPYSALCVSKRVCKNH
jgi:hypothetical protein